jgi:hypothetical protein
MNKTVVGALSALALLVAFPAGLHAHHAGAQHNLGQPDYERTASSGEKTVLAHTKSAAKHTICQTLHDTDQAIIHYDDNEMILGPGHCVEVEASYISAAPATDGTKVHVYGWDHHHRGGNK